MIKTKLKKELDLRVQTLHDEWSLITPWIHKEEYREASYGLTRLICEAQKLKLTLDNCYHILKADAKKDAAP